MKHATKTHTKYAKHIPKCILGSSRKKLFFFFVAISLTLNIHHHISNSYRSVYSHSFGWCIRILLDYLSFFAKLNFFFFFLFICSIAIYRAARSPNYAGWCFYFRASIVVYSFELHEKQRAAQDLMHTTHSISVVFILNSDRDDSRIKSIYIFVYCKEMIRNIILLFVCWSRQWERICYS